MNTAISATVIVRQRGQITIPDKIREKYPWANPNNVVTIDAAPDNKIIIEPLKEKKNIDWDALWMQLERVRAYKGRRGNLSKFIAEDRYKH